MPFARHLFGGIPDFSDPRGIASDPKGILYVSTGDKFYGIWKLDLNRNIITQYSGSTKRGAVNGHIKEATYNIPTSMCFNSSNNSLFICDTYNNQIRKIDTEREIVETVAGNLYTCDTRDGNKKEACFYQPIAITIGNDDVIYVGQAVNIRKICMTVDGVYVTTLLTLPENVYRISDMTMDLEQHHLYVTRGTHLYCIDVNTLAVVSVSFDDQPVEKPLFGVQYNPISHNILFVANSSIWKYSPSNQSTSLLRKSIMFQRLGSLALCGSHLFVIDRDQIQELIFYSMPWTKQRLLWIGHLKHGSAECVFAKVPRDILKEIIRYYQTDERDMEQYQSNLPQFEGEETSKKRKLNAD